MADYRTAAHRHHNADSIFERDRRVSRVQVFRVVADAGYESEENYLFLEKNGQTAFIKPANYEISKKQTYQKDIGRIENMSYDEAKDTYTCKNEKELPLAYIRHSKSKTGYISEKISINAPIAKVALIKVNVSKGITARHQWKKGTKFSL